MGTHVTDFMPSRCRKSYRPNLHEHVFRRIARDGFDLDGASVPWHVALARADRPETLDQLLCQIDDVRWHKGRITPEIYGYGDRVTPGHVAEVMPDADILVALGAEPDGSVDTAACPARMPPPERLDRPGHHRVRWCGIVNNFLNNLEHYPDEYHLAELEPVYVELLFAAHRLFGTPVTERPLPTLPGGAAGHWTRLCNRLVEDGKAERPVRVGDLPHNRWRLRSVPGVGHGSVALIEDGLLDVLTSWRET